MEASRPRRSSSPSRRLGRRVHGDVRGDRPRARELVWALVRRVPPGRVVTYGQVASHLENRLSARAVGWAMRGCPDDVPWHRVVNAAGGCSTERRGDLPPGLQRALLEREGIPFGEDDTLDLERWRWRPRRR